VEDFFLFFSTDLPPPESADEEIPFKIKGLCLPVFWHGFWNGEGKD
jgi:hypothetical protein